VRLDRLLANLGYGSRRDVVQWLRDGRITHVDARSLGVADHVAHDDLRFDGEPLDPAPGLLVMLHKPVGYTCSTRDPGRLVHELLPPRFRLRNPILSSVGRLDRDTSGLLLLTDDGALLHRIIAPKSQLAKIYEVTLAADLRGDEAAVFASGGLLLESETRPLAPVGLDVLAPRRVRVSLHEGRYHQVRRMFAAVGNHVATLHRVAIGGLELGDLPPGAWRMLDAAERLRLLPIT
jgi:16S rRNA pseudouridine516 synthase